MYRARGGLERIRGDGRHDARASGSRGEFRTSLARPRRGARATRGAASSRLARLSPVDSLSAARPIGGEHGRALAVVGYDGASLVREQRDPARAWGDRGAQDARRGAAQRGAEGKAQATAAGRTASG